MRCGAWLRGNIHHGRGRELNEAGSVLYFVAPLYRSMRRGADTIIVFFLLLPSFHGDCVPHLEYFPWSVVIAWLKISFLYRYKCQRFFFFHRGRQFKASSKQKRSPLTAAATKGGRVPVSTHLWLERCRSNVTADKQDDEFTFYILVIH